MQTQNSKQGFLTNVLLLFLGALPFVVMLLTLPWLVG